MGGGSGGRKPFHFQIGDTIAGGTFKRIEKKKNESTSQGFGSCVIIPSCRRYRVWARRELLMCKGINWAKLRLDHKCKVASAATRLYSLVAYKHPLLLQQQATPCIRRFLSCSVCQELFFVFDQIRSQIR